MHHCKRLIRSIMLAFCLLAGISMHSSVFAQVSSGEPSCDYCLSKYSGCMDRCVASPSNIGCTSSCSLARCFGEVSSEPGFDAKYCSEFGTMLTCSKETDHCVARCSYNAGNLMASPETVCQQNCASAGLVCLSMARAIK